MDEVFQNETRFPGGEWKAASEPFTDVVSTTHWCTQWIQTSSDLCLFGNICIKYFKWLEERLNKLFNRMERRALTLGSLIVLLVGFGKMSGRWMTTGLWMIKVQTLCFTGWNLLLSVGVLYLDMCALPPRLGVWSYHSPRWQAPVLGPCREGLPRPSQEAACSTSQESCGWSISWGGEDSTEAQAYIDVTLCHMFMFIMLLLFHAHRGRTEVTQKAGSSPPWLAGSSTVWSVLQTHSVADAGGGRWPQRTG